MQLLDRSFFPVPQVTLQAPQSDQSLHPPSTAAKYGKKYQVRSTANYKTLLHTIVKRRMPSVSLKHFFYQRLSTSCFLMATVTTTEVMAVPMPITTTKTMMVTIMATMTVMVMNEDDDKMKLF